MNQRAGFTLIEVIAVLMILALTAGAVSVSLSGPQRSVQVQDVVDRIAHDDALCRQQARRLNAELELVIDLERQQIWRRVLDERRSADELDATAAWTVPDGYAFEALHVQGQGRVHRQAALRYAPHGRSLSYAVQVTAPPSREGHPLSRWLVIVGVSGQVVEVDDMDQAQAMLELLKDEQTRR